MNTKGTLPIRLKYFREKKGLSQTEVAKHLGISRQAISNWEAQKAYPDLDNIVLLCKLYEISVDELLDTNTKEQLSVQAPPSETKILENTPQSVLEMLCLAVILILACQFSILGMLVPIITAIWVKKSKRNYKIIYILCIICFLISLQNTYVIIEHFFKLGQTNLNPI